MNASPTPPIPDPHEDVQLLLPWYASGRLDADERSRVAAHLADCADCTREADEAKALGAALAGGQFDPDKGWAALLPRLDPAPRSAMVLPFARRLRAVAAPMLLAAGVAIGAILLPGNIPTDSTAPAGASYRGLGQTALPGNALLILAPGQSEAGLRDTVRAAGASIVAGPTAANAWVLHVPQDGFEKRLAQLQADDRVRLAHPLTEAPAP